MYKYIVIGEYVIECRHVKYLSLCIGCNTCNFSKHYSSKSVLQPNYPSYKKTTTHIHIILLLKMILVMFYIHWCHLQGNMSFLQIHFQAYKPCHKISFLTNLNGAGMCSTFQKYRSLSLPEIIRSDVFLIPISMSILIISLLNLYQRPPPPVQTQFE